MFTVSSNEDLDLEPWPSCDNLHMVSCLYNHGAGEVRVGLWAWLVSKILVKSMDSRFNKSFIPKSNMERD